MGLRINTNLGALSALRNLQRNTVREVQTFERLSSGLAINRGSDNPSGLVLLEQFRSQLAAIGQAVENSQNASNLVNTADAALGQVSDLIVNARSSVLASLNTGVVGDEARRALQFSLDRTIAAIDRIGATTRFAGTNLLNGNLGFQLANVSPELTNVDVQGGTFQGGFPVQVSVSVTSAATRGQASGTIAAVQSGASTINIQGNVGSAQIQIAAGSTQANVVAAINAQTSVTGVEATVTGEIRSVEYGSQASVRVEEVSGDLEGIATGLSTGTDIVAAVNGVTGTGSANTVQVDMTALSASISVQPDTAGTFSFTIEGGGATFQVGPTTGGLNDFTIGIGPVSAATLGESSGSGNLQSLATGGTNSLSNSGAGALSVLDAAGREVTALRSRLGSVSTNIFETNVDSLNVAFENLTASASDLGDANFAEEIAAAVRNRLVRESGINVLRQANLNAGLLLRLLA